MARIESRTCRWYCCQHYGFTGTIHIEIRTFDRIT